MKTKLASLFLVAALAALIIGSYFTASVKAAQYDIYVAVRTGTGTVFTTTSGTVTTTSTDANINLPNLGPNGAWMLLSGTGTGYLRASGSGVKLSAT
jgi:FtsH-binding integral membrane protein